MHGFHQHIIKKQVIEVTSYGVDGFSVQKEAERICKQQLIPQLERLLDALHTEESMIIDELFVEVDASSLNDLENTLTGKVLAEIEAILLEKIPSAIKSGPLELFVFYLQKGYLPWWSALEKRMAWKLFLDRLFARESSGYNWQLLNEACQQAIVRERLVSELSADQFWSLLQFLSPTEIPSLKSISLEVQNYLSDASYARRFDKAFKLALLRSLSDAPSALASNAIVENALLSVLKTVPVSAIRLLNPAAISDKALGAAVEAIQEKFVSSTGVSTDPGPAVVEIDESAGSLLKRKVAEPDEIYISNSGLAIIAAYLPMFFRNTQLLANEKLLDVPKAVALLHHIVYPGSEYSAFECVLPRILCGVDVEAVVPICEISDSETEKINELLLAVIDHWKALKNTSIEGLRTSFLQREGKLSFVDDEWHLTVGSASYDLLISFLPWNIGIIKLPWMKHRLKVDWLN